MNSGNGLDLLIARELVIRWTGVTYVASWLSILPDGRAEHVEVPWPGLVQGEILRFPDPPRRFRGNAITDTSVVNLASMYVGYLGELIYEAEMRWLRRSPVWKTKPACRT